MNQEEKKERQVKNIHKYLKQYKYCYAFVYKNMTNIAMISLKEYFKDSVFMIGKNHVMQIGLGKTEDDNKNNEEEKNEIPQKRKKSLKKEIQDYREQIAEEIHDEQEVFDGNVDIEWLKTALEVDKM